MLLDFLKEIEAERVAEEIKESVAGQSVIEESKTAVQISEVQTEHTMPVKPSL